MYESGFRDKIKICKGSRLSPFVLRRFKKLNMLLERVTRKVHKWNDYDRSLSFDLSLLDKKNGIILNDFAVERF